MTIVQIIFTIFLGIAFIGFPLTALIGWIVEMISSWRDNK